MKYLLIFLILMHMVITPASALEITAPEVPPDATQIMPENTEDFGEAFLELLRSALFQIRPDIAEACKLGVCMMACVLLISLLRIFPGNIHRVTTCVGVTAIAGLIILDAQAMVSLATETIRQMSDYGKLLFPVMTAAMSVSGGISSSAALYAGTAAFDMILGSLISHIHIPLVYLFLVCAMGNCASGEELLKKLRDLIKNLIGWSLKLTVTIFTTYMSITGVVSGTTDAAALKTMKVTISSVVPVVGGILSDASESVLVSTRLLKNAAGIYGIIAVLALFLEPFIKIAVQYFTLKATAALCSVFGTKEISELIDDFGAAMGFLLAMTGAVCLMLLISVFCFMKEVG